MPPMRILIASDLHQPSINGVATFGQNLAHGLADAGHEVAVVAPSQTGASYVEIDGNHRIVRTKSRVFPLYQDLRISPYPNREILRFVREFAPDVIHVQTPMGIGNAAIVAAKRCGIPLVLTNHSMSENLMENVTLLAPFAHQINPILQKYGEWFCSRADYVTLPTQAAIGMLRPDDFRKPTSAISNGIDLSRFHPDGVPDDFRERFGIPEDLPVVLYLGRVDAEKHIFVLVQAARHMLGEGRAFHLVVVGFGVDRQHLESLVASYGMQEHVTFTGRIEEEDKPYFFRTATVFAMPSPAELQSIATLEAMASGLPVVAVNAGALYELCEDGHNGFLYDLDDVDGMRRGLAAVLDDPALAERMGAASLEIARRHDLRETIRKYASLYERAIANRDCAPKG
jgi:glycosyltransferase involved in cell wall biosynthesis